MKKEKCVGKIVADFIVEHGTNRTVFLQHKYVDVNMPFYEADHKRDKLPKIPNFKANEVIMITPHTDIESETFKNRFDFIYNTEPKDSSFKGLRQSWNAANVATLAQGETVKPLQRRNVKKQPIMTECAGDYCDINDINLQENLPDFHQMMLIKMRSDQEKGLNANITTKSFVDADDMLPKSNHMIYQIPNIIVLLD